MVRERGPCPPWSRSRSARAMFRLSPQRRRAVFPSVRFFRFQQGHEVGHFPQPIRHASGHSGRDADCAVDAAQSLLHSMPGNHLVSLLGFEHLGAAPPRALPFWLRSLASSLGGCLRAAHARRLRQSNRSVAWTLLQRGTSIVRPRLSL